MKKIVSIVLASTLFFALAACSGGSSSSTASSTAAATEPPVSQTDSIVQSEISEISEPESTAAQTTGSPTTEIKEYRVVPLDGLTGGTDMLVLGKITNTGDVPVFSSGGSLDVMGQDGALLKSQSMVTVYPNVINPGESGYICEQAVNSTIDTSISVDQIASIEPNFLFSAHAPRKEIDVEILNPTLNEKMTFPNFVCQVTNNGAEELSLLYVVCPVFSAEGELLTVIFSIVNSLAPGETASVDQMAIQYDKNADYATATIEPFAYVAELF